MQEWLIKGNIKTREDNSQTAGNMAAARSPPHPEPGSGPAVPLSPRQEQKFPTIFNCRPNIRGENHRWLVTLRETDRCFGSRPLQVQLSGDTGVGISVCDHRSKLCSWCFNTDHRRVRLFPRFASKRCPGTTRL